MNAVTTTQPRTMQTILVPTTFDQLVIFADMAAASGMVPKDYVNKPGAIMIACQMGSELGLSPMQSLNSIAVINGRPGVFGDGLIGLCRQSPLCQDIVETISGEGDQREAVCVATRRGATPVTGRFSVTDAKKAGLWGKSGPWSQYPDRMLTNRARSFALRDAFPDVLRGLKTAEELIDTPPDTFRGATLEAAKEPVRSLPDHPKAGTFDHRAAISAETPIPPKRQTAREWLTAMHTRLAACTTLDEVEEIAASPEVRRALEGLRNGALMELNALLADAMERLQPGLEAEVETAFAAENDDTFPGDRPNT